MSKKKRIARHLKSLRISKRKRYLTVAAASLAAFVVFGSTLGPWKVSKSFRAVFIAPPPPPPVPPAGSPSKEYIYAGGRLVATEEAAYVTLLAPASVTAVGSSASQVDISWAAAPNAHHYQVERSPSISSSYSVINFNVASTSFSDNTVSSVNAYLYRVRAADAAGNLSPPSNIDVATAISFTDNSLSTGTTPIKAEHVTELRQAVNAVRAAANLGGASWTDSSLSGAPVKAVHIQELRTNLDQALSALGIATSQYTDSSLSGVVVKAVHVNELRQRVR